MTISISRPRRTGHPPISYRDDTTDDESENPLHSRSSHRLRRESRPQTSEEDTDSDRERQTKNANHSRSKASPSIPPRTNRSSRRIRNVTNYNEDSDADFGEVNARVSQHPRPLPATSKPRRKRAQPSQPTLNKGPFHAFKRRKINHDDPSKAFKTSTTANLVIPPGKIPPWQTLPYQILLSILQYASYPFYRDASRDVGSIAWLLQTSTLSKSFHDAAVATLLYSPPLFPSDRAHGLQRLLDTPQETLSTTYRNKVKRLDVEVRNLLMKKSGIDLVSLIKQTPLLSSLHLYHNYDRIGAVNWAQPYAATGRSWAYPSELFEALDENKIRLQEWSWNGRFPDTKVVIDQMEHTHSQECLKGLKSLSILNFAAPEKVKEDKEHALADSLTTAVKMLPGLQELKFQNCSLVNKRVLESLPSQLRHLSIIDCGKFSSVDLTSHLAEKGYELEELILKGNQALDLGFTGSLEKLCPRLRVFHVNLTYSDPTAFHDVDPHYEAVFPDGIMPTWPRNLQTIDIENLRNLDAQDAEGFLRSLIGVAPELKDLRKLSIRILLQDDGWRERAKLRQTWMPKLEDIFLRRAAPPTPFIPPTLQRPLFPPTTTHSRPSTSSSLSSSSLTPDTSTSATPNKRKSARIAQREIDDLANQAFKNTTSTISKKASRGAAGRRHDNINNRENDDDDDPSATLPRQGMCTEVTLHIDGQRPADEQFKEADFLDDELSGDEEWNGRDVEVGGRHAW